MAPSVHTSIRPEPPARWAIGRALFADGCVRHHEAQRGARTHAGHALICDGTSQERLAFQDRAQRLRALDAARQPVAVELGQVRTGEPYRIDRIPRAVVLSELLSGRTLGYAGSFEIALRVTAQLQVLHHADLTHGALDAGSVAVERRHGARRVWLLGHAAFGGQPSEDLRQLGLLLREIAAERRHSAALGQNPAVEALLDGLVHGSGAWTADRVYEVLVQNPTTSRQEPSISVM